MQQDAVDACVGDPLRHECAQLVTIIRQQCARVQMVTCVGDGLVAALIVLPLMLLIAVVLKVTADEVIYRTLRVAAA